MNRKGHDRAGRRRRGGAGAVLVLTCLGCGNPPEEIRFEDVFTLRSSLELNEPDVPIGAIQAIERRPGGGYFILDPLTHRVLAFDSAGRPVGSAGREGEGPGEFMRPWSFTTDDDGRVLVSDPGTARITVLDPGLELVEVHPLETAAAWITGFGEDLILEMAGADGERLHLYSLETGRRRSFHPMPPQFGQNPYWPRLARLVATAGAGEVIAGYNLDFPLTRYDAGGDSVGIVGDRTPSFDVIDNAPDDGSLTRFGPDGLDDFFASFDIISGLEIVENRLLVVARGRYERDPGRFVVEMDEFIDVYDLDTGRPIHQGVPVPAGATILGGGEALLMQMSSPPDPWRIAEFSILSGPGNEEGQR